jgi:transcription elongation factor Elf1
MNRRDKDKLARIEELEWKNLEHRDRLLLLKDIVVHRAACKERLEIEGFPEDLIRSCLSHGNAVVSADKLNISSGPVIKYAGELEQILERNGLVNGAPLDLRECIYEDQTGKLDMTRMIELTGTLDPARQLIITEALKPVFERCRELCEPFFDDPSWLQPYCYVCGGEPDMAGIEGDDNRRYLHCGLCDASWHYLRLKCPFCGNENQNELVSLSIEGDADYSIDACQICNRYLKVVDARVATAVSLPEVEALLSIRLDVAARKEGFI